MSTTHKKLDVHQEITDRIVAAIESAGPYEMPWIKSRSGSIARPVNIASKSPYNGINILSLWIAAYSFKYPTPVWGTYKQWQQRGVQVRKGEKASLVVFYKSIESDENDTAESDDTEPSRQRLIARASHVFNAAQVEAFTPPVETNLPEVPAFDPIEHAEAFVKATGAVITEAGDEACYEPATDKIRMPERRRFTGTSTTSPAEGFYSTLCHELVHWSGVRHRLDRDLSTRFGSEAYAMEELIAELGAAFLCADLSITPEPRVDHASYIATWLKVLKDDKRAIFTAAAKASQAANWLQEPG